jgi:cytochrome c-type biogenesis protein CcmF
MFLGLMAVLLAGGGVLIIRRRRDLSPARAIGSLVAREALVLASAFLLLLLTGVVLVGTLWIPLSSLIVGRMVQIGPEFYNNVLAPIGLLLLAATSVAPLLRWGGAPRRTEQLALLAGTCIALAAAVAAGVLGVRHPIGFAVAGLAALSVASVVAGLILDAQRYAPTPLQYALWRALRKRRRQYAGYVVHLAFVCLTIGIAGSALGTRQRDVELGEGDVIEWAGRRIEYRQLVQRDEPEKLVAEVELRVSRGERPPVVLKPARHFHLLQNQWTTEVAIDSTWSGDFYTILHAGLGEGRVLVTLIENPLMRWLWLGGWLGAAGAATAAWPARRRRISQMAVPMRTLHIPQHGAPHPERRAA